MDICSGKEHSRHIDLFLRTVMSNTQKSNKKKIGTQRKARERVYLNLSPPLNGRLSTADSGSFLMFFIERLK